MTRLPRGVRIALLLGLSLVLAHARALSGAVGVATGPAGTTLSVVLPLSAARGRVT